MDTKQAYDLWAAQYDTNKNKTRDLEGVVLRSFLTGIPFNNCLEIGCGTGKNTLWLLDKAASITAVDLSPEMLSRAREKISAPHVQFIQADITESWSFGHACYDLVSFSLVLEHILNLDHVFQEASRALKAGGYVYLGELHPYKQYAGTKARFDTEAGRQVVNCYDHHASDFIRAAKKSGFALVDLDEFFDEDNRSSTPRILTILFKKG